LLYAVLTVLMRNRPLVPGDVYGPMITIPSGQTLANVPVEIRNDSLPLEAALSDQIRDLGDFWGTMKMVWKPTIGLTVTIPVIPGVPDTTTAPVTTLGAEWLQQTNTATLEGWFTIGGRALTGTGDTTVPHAWILIRGVSADVVQVNRRVLSRADGSFIFERLRAGQYHLRAVAAGFGDIGRDIDIPSPTGEYDMRFP
jgi:hypothetical protein